MRAAFRYRGWHLFANIRDREREDAIATLERLHILTVVPEPATPRAYQLSPSFSLSLRRALTGGGNHKSFGIPCSETDPSKPTVQWLDQWAKTKWENILDFMVGSSGNMRSNAQLKKATITLLQWGNLVSSSNRITKGGFEFVLQEANTQVWSLLIVYLTAGEGVRMTLTGFGDKTLMDTAAGHGDSRGVVLPFHAWIPRIRPGLWHGITHRHAKTHARRSRRLWHCLCAS